MKKNAMLKIAAVLLVAVLLTTCAISSTFAKYVSDLGSHTETARVAKWGITVTTKINDSDSLFSNDYEGMITSKDDDNVFAPGATDTYRLFVDMSGEAEVDTKVIFKGINGATDEFLKVTDNAKYLKWYMAESETALATAPETTVSAINTAIKALNKDFAANTSVAATREIWIKWVWEFETDPNNDTNDTNLGKAATYDAVDVTFTVNAEIVQDGPAFAEAE
jgi:hypothetical protein